MITVLATMHKCRLETGHEAVVCGEDAPEAMTILQGIRRKIETVELLEQIDAIRMIDEMTLREDVKEDTVAPKMAEIDNLVEIKDELVVFDGETVVDFGAFASHNLLRGWHCQAVVVETNLEFSLL